MKMVKNEINFVSEENAMVGNESSFRSKTLKRT